MKLIEILKTQPERIAFAVLAVVSGVMAGFAIFAAVGALGSQTLIVAAGPGRTESSLLMQAVKRVVERHNPGLKITIHETLDANDSLWRLERGEADLAVSQADATAPPVARVAIVLFENVFQLVAHKEANIHAVPDLKGKKIALAPNGAQHESFLFVAAHFGLAPGEFTFLGADNDTADAMFARKDADAVFRVRALHNAAIDQAAQSGKVDLIPIGDAAAMHAKMPAYSPTVIPKGAYMGNPPVPSADIEAVAVKQILLAREDADEDAVAAVTQALMERRPELGAYIQTKDPTVLPLLAQIQQPTPAMALGLAVHPGARRQYDGGRPPFVQSYADLVAASLVGLALVALWLWALGRSASRRRKQRLDQYLERIAGVAAEVETAASDQALRDARREMVKLMRSALVDARRGGISETAFRTVRLAWQVGADALRERRAALRAGAAENRGQTPISLLSAKD